MCRDHYSGDYSLVCSKLYCCDNNMGWYIGPPFDGTVCGNRKMCKKGQCLTSPNASIGSSNTCPHGDNPGLLPYLNISCLDIRSQNSLHFRCNDMHFAFRCCETCTIVETLQNGARPRIFLNLHSTYITPIVKT